MEQRTITKSDLAAPNPYNTYKINGLPPGPIGNPGRAALEAVANPAISNELFFVADGTGGHVFAETFEEHKKNVDRWREIEKARKASDPSAVPTSSGTGMQTTLSPVPPAPGAPAAIVPGARQTPAGTGKSQARKAKPAPVPADAGPVDQN